MLVMTWSKWPGLLAGRCGNVRAVLEGYVQCLLKLDMYLLSDQHYTQ